MTNAVLKNNSILTFAIKRIPQLLRNLIIQKIGHFTRYETQVTTTPSQGEKTHNEDKAKSPICQDLDDWHTGKRKRRSPAPCDHYCTWLQINVRPWSVRYFYIEVISTFIFIPNQHKLPDQWIVLTIQTVTETHLQFQFNTIP